VHTPRSPAARAFEVASLTAAAGLAAALAWRHGALAAQAPLPFAAGAAAGALAADLVTGVVHWLCDRFGSERTPLVGPYLIAGFREHHRNPEAIARHGFCERSGANACAVVPALAAALPAIGALGPGAGAAALGASLAFGLLVALTNEIHLQAHRARPARLAALLQRVRLVLPPREHARHHREGHDRAYCIATGWSNPLLDRLGVFPRLERWLRRP
jgi:ubiquitin-conjugating enzyme E2 variant